MMDTRFQPGTGGLPELPDNDTDFTPDLARKIISKYHELLANPNAVHLNMLRGGIAKPSWDQIKHIYPEQFNDIAVALPNPLIRKWRQEAKHHRTAQHENELCDDDWFLHKTDADRLEQCADELEASALAGREVSEALLYLNEVGEWTSDKVWEQDPRAAKVAALITTLTVSRRTSGGAA